MASNAPGGSGQAESSAPFLDPSDNLKELHNVMGTCAFNWESAPTMEYPCNYWMEFREFLDRSDARWIAIPSEPADWSLPEDPFVAIQPNTPRKLCLLTVLKAPCHLEGNKYAGVIMIWPFGPANELLASLPSNAFGKLDVISVRWDKSFVERIAMPVGKTLAIDFRPKVFYTNQVQLVSILTSAGVPKTMKVLMVLLHMYPYVEDEVKTHALVAPYEHAPEIYLDGLQPYEPEDAQAGDSRYRAATLCYLLISSYTQEGKLGEQLHKRYRAACMSLSTDSLSETDFATERTALGLTVGDTAPVAYQVLGAVLALDKQGIYNPSVKVEDFLTEDQLVAVKGVSPWAATCFTQMKLVYWRMNLTTLDFALDLVKMLNAENQTMVREMEVEQPNIRKAADMVKDAPFVALLAKQPDALQISKFPCTAFVGLVYYGRSLPEKEKENWAKYNVDGVSKHVEGGTLKDKLEQIAAYFPTPTFVDAVEAAIMNQGERLDSILKASPSSAKQELYETLFARKATCKWFLEEKACHELEYMNVLYEKVNISVNRRYTELEVMATAEIMGTVDLQETSNKQAKLMAMKAKLMSNLQRINPTEFFMPIAPSADLKEKHDAALEIYRALMESLNQFTLR